MDYLKLKIENLYEHILIYNPYILLIFLMVGFSFFIVYLFGLKRAKNFISCFNLAIIMILRVIFIVLYLNNSLNKRYQYQTYSNYKNLLFLEFLLVVFYIVFLVINLKFNFSLIVVFKIIHEFILTFFYIIIFMCEYAFFSYKYITFLSILVFSIAKLCINYIYLNR